MSSRTDEWHSARAKTSLKPPGASGASRQAAMRSKKASKLPRMAVSYMYVESAPRNACAANRTWSSSLREDVSVGNRGTAEARVKRKTERIAHSTRVG